GQTGLFCESRYSAAEDVDRSKGATDSGRQLLARHGQNVRLMALNRKNALFAGHDAGAENWATIASLVETCKLNDVDPLAYLTSTLTAVVNGHKQSRIDDRGIIGSYVARVTNDC
ncbi:transposase domain-containing protein, partial [Sinorhizobium fredii]|uniref:transposase domain-containing protein n=1 Tax=Rhizobium fredii TaxID=380 RepID=UPI0030B6AC3D